MSFRLPGELVFRKQWIETRNKRPRYKGWTQSENWKWYSEIRGSRGFVLGDFTVLDFDHVLDDTGEWVNEAGRRLYTELLERFPTWVELSSSGTGLHTWYRWECFKFSIRRLDFDKKNRIGVDLCEGHKRQVLVTGRVYEDNKMAAVDDTLREFIRSRFSISCTPTRVINTRQSTQVNTSLKDRGRETLNQIDCTSLDRDDWVKVTTCCKQLGLFREWNEWCQTDPRRYKVRENQRIWNHCEPTAIYPVKCLELFVKD